MSRPHTERAAPLALMSPALNDLAAAAAMRAPKSTAILRTTGTALALAALCAFATPALALEPLAQEKHINDSLRAGRIGDVIRKTCPTIDARMFVVWSKIEGLKQYALKKGYPRNDIEAFLKDPKEKQRLKAEADLYLTKAGAKAGNAESFCKIGRDEIAKKTLIGSLLRSRI